MSQLSNIVQVFANNDLVTAAKLNNLVLESDITTEVITDQPAASGAFVEADLVLGRELSTNQLVKVSITKIRATGLVLNTDFIYPSANPVQGGVTIDSSDANAAGGDDQNITINAGAVLGIVAITGKRIDLGNLALGQSIVIRADAGVTNSFTANGGKRAALLQTNSGSPVVTVTQADHALIVGDIVEVFTPAEYAGTFAVATVVSTSAFTYNLAANATTTSNPSTFVNRPALRSKELAYLDRLKVSGTAKFSGATEFTSMPVIQGTTPYQLYSIQELEMITPWTATTAGFYNSIFTSALLTKPASEIWVVSGSFHVQTTGYPTYVGIRYSNVTAQTGQYLALNTFEDTSNGSVVFDYNWDLNFTIPAATTFTDLSFRLDVNATAGSQARVGHTSSFQNMFAGATAPVWPQSKLTIHKYKVS